MLQLLSHAAVRVCCIVAVMSLPLSNNPFPFFLSFVFPSLNGSFLPQKPLVRLAECVCAAIAVITAVVAPTSGERRRPPLTQRPSAGGHTYLPTQAARPAAARDAGAGARLKRGK